MSASSRSKSIMLRRRPVSCSISWSLPSARHDSATAADSRPMIATTTSSSRRVKPALEVRAARLLQIPVADVGIDTLAAFLAIGAERIDVEFAALARGRIVVRLIPRVLGDLLQHLFPIRRGRFAGIRHERFQTLGGARVAEVVEPIEIQGGFDLADVLSGSTDGG